jgi:single-stranded DNA-binding protein
MIRGCPDRIHQEAAVPHVALTLRKGTAVTIEDRLQTRTWEAVDGSQRRATEIVATNVRAG